MCLARFCCEADLLLYHGGEAPRTLICNTNSNVSSQHTGYFRLRIKLANETHRVAAAESAHNQIVNLQGV